MRYFWYGVNIYFEITFVLFVLYHFISAIGFLPFLGVMGIIIFLKLIFFLIDLVMWRIWFANYTSKLIGINKLHEAVHKGGWE